MKTLIFSASWCPDEEKRELCLLWAKLLDKHSPDYDVLLIDCRSPFDPAVFLSPLGYRKLGGTLDCLPDHGGSFFPRRFVWSWPDNIGHLSLGGKDGWGRTFCKGIEVALASDYDNLVYLEADVLLAKPVAWIIDKLSRSAGVVSPLDCVYHFIDNEIVAMKCDWLKRIGFASKYRWEYPPDDPTLHPEKRCEAVFGDDLLILPMRGVRNDQGFVTPDNIETGFPMGIDWITHCRNFSVYDAFLRINGHGDLCRRQACEG